MGGAVRTCARCGADAQWQVATYRDGQAKWDYEDVCNDCMEDELDE
jgi:superfamily II helicase